MKKAAVDLLLLAQREKYLSLLRQVEIVLQSVCDEFGDFGVEDKHALLQAVREALK